MATIQSNFLFNSHVRPAWAGPITISDNKASTTIDPLAHKNPRWVGGVVVPVTTKGRKTAPVAFSGQQTGKPFGTDKGHMYGLEIGGPDISENISPQSNLWQQSGGWRRMEREALAWALQWIGINQVYDPANIPAQSPGASAYLVVAPYPEVDPGTGEPLQYTGTITRVTLYPGGYRVDPTVMPRIIYIKPNDPWI